MPLTPSQKVNIRRHMRFPVAGLARSSPYGAAFASGTISYRFFDIYGQMEYRLNNLDPAEEATVVGSYYGSVIIIGNPEVNDQISFSISASGMPAQTVSYTVQPAGNLPNPNGAQNPVQVSQGLVNSILQNTVLLNNQFTALSPLGIGPFAQYSPTLVNPNLEQSGLSMGTPGLAVTNISTAYQIANLSVVNQPGSTLSAFIELNGSSKLPPISTVDPTTNPPTVLNGYLPILDYLEGALAGATQNLDTWKADVWTARGTELDERLALYMWWIFHLADFLGVGANNTAQGSGKINPGIRGSNSVIV
jgi:hypothetical protein